MRAVRVAAVVAVLAVGILPAHAEDRSALVNCKAMVEHATHAQGSDSAARDDAALQKCRQIIKEWTLRDSRMSIDEQGRPLR